MQFSQVGNIEKIKKSKQFSQDEATERTRKGRKDNKRKRGKDRSWMEEQKKKCFNKSLKTKPTDHFLKIEKAQSLKLYLRF